MSGQLTGSCYCGAIEYSMKDDGNRDGVACHCRTCQKIHSSASYNVKSDQESVKVTKGSPKVYKDTKADSGKAVNRYFCGDCGSALWSDPEAMSGVRFVKVGPLDSAKDVKLAADIYVDTALAHTPSDKSKSGHKQFEGMMAKEV